MGLGYISLSAEIPIDPETAEAIGENITGSLQELSHLSLSQIAQRFADSFTKALPSIGTAVVFFLVGYLLIRLLMRFLRHTLERTKTDTTLYGFILSTIKIVLFVILGITCIGILGVNFTPLLTALGALGLAVSLAVRDILANIAGGIALLFSRPFAKGDYVEVSGQPGTVREIGMVYTILQTIDNKKIYLPNGDVAKATIINYSAEPIRRLDLTFTIGRNSDFSHVKELALEVIEKSTLALADPPPIIRFSDQTYAYVKMTVFVWTETANILQLKSDLIGDIREALRQTE